MAGQSGLSSVHARSGEKIMNLQTYCLVDRKPIPEERARNRSNTCSNECNQALAKMRRARVDARKCRHCAKPSTPEERKAFHAWLKQNPEYRPPKNVRPNKTGESK
jgi:hypothetical protein